MDRWLVGNVEYASAVVTLQSADVASMGSENRIGLQIEADQQRLENGFYIISATLRNDTSTSVRLLRAVLTLRDDQGRITGYRVMALSGDLGGNEQITLDISAVSQTGDLVSHTLFVEAIKN